jgi:hypothetical protein
LCAKELPEDGELDLSDIPAIAPASRTSFSFVEDEVRVHLAHLPAAQVDEVLQRLRRFRNTYTAVIAAGKGHPFSA